MRKKVIAAFLVFTSLGIIALAVFAYFRLWPQFKPAIGPVPSAKKAKPTPGSRNLTSLPLKLPRGFQIETFAENLGPARFMAFDRHGTLIVSVTRDNKVIALPDADHNGRADSIVTLLDGLDLPHGLAFRGNELYVAETGRIRKYEYRSPGPKEQSVSGGKTVVPDLPAGGIHFTRTISFGPDGKMYISIGSSVNVDIEQDKRRAAISRCDPDGSHFEVFATGLRNSVGLAWHPITRLLWATDNGRDWLGDDLPPDEVNIIKKGNDYGWPYAYGDKITDPAFNDPARAEKTTPPFIQLQAHSAPLGLAFFDSPDFGDDYENDLFIAFHGSWNRSVPTGYKVVRVHLTGKDHDKVGYIEDFITGWLTSDGAVGRPVGVIVGPDGALYISDDKSGRVYRVTKIRA